MKKLPKKISKVKNISYTTEDLKTLSNERVVCNVIANLVFDGSATKRKSYLFTSPFLIADRTEKIPFLKIKFNILLWDPDIKEVLCESNNLYSIWLGHVKLVKPLSIERQLIWRIQNPNCPI